RHTRSTRDWSSDVCSSDLIESSYGTAEFLAQRAGIGQELEVTGRISIEQSQQTDLLRSFGKLTGHLERDRAARRTTADHIWPLKIGRASCRERVATAVR